MWEGKRGNPALGAPSSNSYTGLIAKARPIKRLVRTAENFKRSRTRMRAP